MKLNAQLAGNVTESVARTSSDGDLSVQSGRSLTFTPTNWQIAKDVTLAAAQDQDAAQGTATFAVSAPGLPTIMVNASENYDDALALVITPMQIMVPEGGFAFATVTLNLPPPASTALPSPAAMSAGQVNNLPLDSAAESLV